MKFLCKTEFYHSGVRLYAAGAVYSDITAKTAEELIAVDSDIPLGALSFFTPVDDEAINFVKARKGNTPTTSGDNAGATPSPKKAELIAEAKNLGIKGANFMNEEKLKQVIEAAKTNPPASPTPTSGDNAGATGGATPQV